MLLEAGAGTGKTGVLVDRYCDLIEGQDAGPEAILAFTFTDRAGAQLRERIRTELGRRARSTGDGDLAARLAAVIDDLGGAWITTIHGFCRRLLASHPVAAGVDPSFRVLDRAQSQRAARAAFDAALELFLADLDEARETTVAAYSIDGLRAAVLGAHEELRSSGEARPELPDPPESDLLGALERLGREAAVVKRGRQQRPAGEDRRRGRARRGAR